MRTCQMLQLSASDALWMSMPDRLQQRSQQRSTAWKIQLQLLKWLHFLQGIEHIEGSFSKCNNMSMSKLRCKLNLNATNSNHQRHFLRLLSPLPDAFWKEDALLNDIYLYGKVKTHCLISQVCPDPLTLYSKENKDLQNTKPLMSFGAKEDCFPDKSFYVQMFSHEANLLQGALWPWTEDAWSLEGNRRPHYNARTYIAIVRYKEIAVAKLIHLQSTNIAGRVDAAASSCQSKWSSQISRLHSHHKHIRQSGRLVLGCLPSLTPRHNCTQEHC